MINFAVERAKDPEERAKMDAEREAACKALAAALWASLSHGVDPYDHDKHKFRVHDPATIDLRRLNAALAFHRRTAADTLGRKP